MKGVILAGGLVFLLFRTPPLVAATASLLTGTILLSLEIFFFAFFFAAGFLPQEILGRPVLRILFLLPQLIVLCLVTWFCAKKKISILSPRPSNPEENEGKVRGEERGRRS